MRPLTNASVSLGNEPMVSCTHDDLKSDPSALARLFEQERDRLRRFLASRINRRLTSRIDASDVIQEVFFRADQALPAYLSNPALPPTLWLRHLSSQVLSELHRKHLRLMRNPFLESHQSDESIVLSLTSSSISIASKVDRAEVASRIRLELQRLDQTDRKIFELRHVDGLQFKEIAPLLDLHCDAVKKRYYRGLQRFRHVMELTD